MFVVVKVKLESVPKDRTKLFEISMFAGIVLADSLEMNQVKQLTRAGQLCLMKEEKFITKISRSIKLSCLLKRLYFDRRMDRELVSIT